MAQAGSVKIVSSIGDCTVVPQCRVRAFHDIQRGMNETSTSLSEDASLGHNVPAYSVSELSQSLKKMVEGEFGHVRVRGEISGFKRAASGHLYMTLKDDSAVLDAVCWKGVAGRLALQPEDGMEVIATGRLTTYAGRSKYQIVLESIELAGEGALLKLLEDRRRALMAEGLFDEDRKKPLPFLPEVIGVVTSPTGAVIRDILHRLADRFPRHVLLWPVLVQGDEAAEQVAKAIDGFNNLSDGGSVPRPDLIIVARGGGSLEDLWAFNEEIVVRAAAASDIPLISAVGHETDTTLIDYASDHRAPTPTAAAEIAVPVRTDLLAQVLDDSRRLVTGLGRLLDERRLRLTGLARGLPEPRSLIEMKTQQLDDRTERLIIAMKGLSAQRSARLETLAAGLRPASLQNLLEGRTQKVNDLTHRLQQQPDRYTKAAKDKLAGLGALLDSYSYERVLDRGFALLQDTAGNAVTTTGAAITAGTVSIRMKDGAVQADITDDHKPRQKTSKPATKKSASKDDTQGSLL
jgi:exodeoxyribonuclease VII large subunit